MLRYTPMNKDQIYSTSMAKIVDLSFDAQVADVFPNMTKH